MQGVYQNHGAHRPRGQCVESDNNIGKWPIKCEIASVKWQKSHKWLVQRIHRFINVWYFLWKEHQARFNRDRDNFRSYHCEFQRPPKSTGLRRLLDPFFTSGTLWLGTQVSNILLLGIIFSCDQAALKMVFSVCSSVCPSVCHTFFTMFPSSYHHEIFRRYYQWPK